LRSCGAISEPRCRNEIRAAGMANRRFTTATTMLPITSGDVSSRHASPPMNRQPIADSTSLPISGEGTGLAIAIPTFIGKLP